jgi:cytoskeletal protein RodZ
MKRCPQCLFIYPDTDQQCDFDQTPLVEVADSVIDAAGKPRRKTLRLVSVAVVVVLGIAAFLFFTFNRNKNEQTSIDIPSVAQETPLPPAPSPSPSVSPSPSPSPSPLPSAKPSPTGVATSHTTTSRDPVSTSGPGMGTRRGGNPTILLTSGGKIEADEVWRTRDGFWYRKNGIVTFLKHSRVKAIINK